MIALPPSSQMMSDPNMSMLWSMLADLSAALSTNREVTARLFRLAESVGASSTALAAAATASSPDALEELNRSLQLTQSDHQSSLEAENARLREELLAYRTERDDLDLLSQQYDHTIMRIMEGLREYTLTRAESTIEIHSSYSDKLEEERARYDELLSRYTAQEQRIRSLADSLRAAYRYTEETDDPERETKLMEAISEMQVENDGLKRILNLGS
ncbi:uncharacterized protein V2V93DRAFT_374791 [Kockiozyma suomiensis]|uniref:uncharacterized protein n=1 Tax=Kockiozyma suomiensis TaxID=1337062 RepID=UPI003343BBCD